MPAAENLNLIRRWVDAVNRNDVEGELACWHTDAEMLVVPTGTVFRGIAEIRQGGEASAAMVGSQPSAGRKQITNLFGNDDWVCAELDTRATIVGPIALQNVTVIPEGARRVVQTKVCFIAHVRDGKIDRAREYWDSASMARQLGLDSATLASLYSSLGTDPASPP